MSANLATLLTESAARDGAQIAIKLDDTEVNYALLDEGSKRIAGLLRAKGVGSGDRVGVMLPNVPYFPIVYYGILRLGAVVVPMNVLLKGREVGFYLKDSGAKVLFAWADFGEAAGAGAEEAGAELIPVAPGEFEQLVVAAEPIQEVADRAGDDDAVILYTSGTTGTPKGAELTHDNLRRNAEVSRGLHDTSADDVILGALPLFHSFGQTCTLNAGIGAGATITLLPRFDPAKALEIIQRDKVTIFMGVPTMYGAMLHAPERANADLSTLRLCVSGGASLPIELMREFEAAFDAVILEGYGLSETSPVASFNHSAENRKSGSIGTPIEGVQMKVVDEDDNEVPTGEVGEIVIKGHNVMKGYWGRPDATAEAIRDGWFHSGDMARVDEDGYFFIVDRKKDMIIRGGYNVYPREVEDVMAAHPAVREVVVVGIPDDKWGEAVAAFVALRAGESADDAALMAFARERLAGYKVPKSVHFIDEVPKSPVGKLLRRAVRDPFWKDRDRRIG